jgi:hypothetical protein
MKATFMKCGENADNLKKSFGFNMVSWDAQDLSCQVGNY